MQSWHVSNLKQFFCLWMWISSKTLKNTVSNLWNWLLFSFLQAHSFIWWGVEWVRHCDMSVPLQILWSENYNVAWKSMISCLKKKMTLKISLWRPSIPNMAPIWMNSNSEPMTWIRLGKGTNKAHHYLFTELLQLHEAPLFSQNI